MNQLIESRDSQTNQSRKQCDDRIRQLINSCQFLEQHPGSNIEFTPSDDVFMLELQDHSNIKRKHYVQIFLDIFLFDLHERMSKVHRDVVVHDSCVYFCILDESIAMYNYDWDAPLGYSIKFVRMSWYLQGYTVKNVLAI